MNEFYDIHAGETCLLVGNGLNLHKTPPEWFDLPSFGMNTIHFYDGWMPTYYTAVDSRVWREFGKDIAEKYRDIPKFIPYPNLDKWTGENFYRFYHRPGPLLNGQPMDANFMREVGISFGCVMHVAMQLAVWMGFDTLLMIGVEHKKFKAQDHFWGCDHGMSATPPVEQWLDGYREIVSRFADRQILNISVDTYVPDDILPRDDWRKYVSKNEGTF